MTPTDEQTDDRPELHTLTLTPGEASALSYFVAFAALHHEPMTPHEQAMVSRVSAMDPDAFTMWRTAVLDAAGRSEGREKVTR